MRALGMSEPAAGVRPGGRRGSGQSAPGLLAASPGKARGNPAGCRPRALPADGCLGREAGRGGGVPETEAQGGRRLQAEPAVSAQGACRHATAAALAGALASLPLVCAAAGDALSCFQFFISLI